MMQSFVVSLLPCHISLARNGRCSMQDSPIWILTINDNSNYGNRLQNFALQQMLRKYSNDVSTLRAFDISPEIRLKYILKSPLRPLRRDIDDFRNDHGMLRYRRRKNFESFTKRYVDDSKASLYPESGFSRAVATDSRFVIGSDQVWNDRWISPDMLKLRLGQFFPDERFISYAGSFGINEVKTESRGIFSDYLSRMSDISVREDRGAELVHELSGRSARVVLDPTLMIPAEKWSLLSHGFVPDGDDYVLTYFLGKPSDSQEAIIQQYAKEHQYRIRRMIDFTDPETYTAGPREFVELFSKAKFVFTDSYHACCFSIIFGKQFKVFNRAGYTGAANLNSRMLTLFRLFDLDRDMNDESQLIPIDYSIVHELLTNHRAESWQWLDNAMNGISFKK